MGFLDVFKFKRAPTFDENAISSISELSKNVALQRGALEKVANYVGRGVSKAKFIVKGPKPESFKDWVYRLNVQPNPNQVASVFWAEVAKTMITDGEVLIVVINSYLYIAESYSTPELSEKGHTYKVSAIQGVAIDKTFKSDDVIVLRNENEALENYSNQLWSDYGELIGRLINRQKTANQIRFTLSLPKNRIHEKAQEVADGGNRKGDTQKRFFERVVEKIQKDSVVAIPVNGESAYNEYSNRYSSKASFVDDIKQVKNQYVDELCEVLGIPSALIHGDIADNQKNYDQVVEVVLEPMVQKIIDGLTVAMFKEEEYFNRNRIKVVGLHYRDLFDIATPGDKLIAAGLAMADEIREEIDLPPLPNGLGQKLYITKNYLELGVEGGRTDENTLD